MLVFSCALAAGCRVYDPTLIRRDSGVLDSGGRDADTTADAPCSPHVPPARPSNVDATEGPELVFALKDVVLNQGADAWRMIGYDLDGLCSVPPDPVVECHPPRASVGAETDGVDGIDNSFGHNFFPLIMATITTIEMDARAAQAAGIGSLVVRIRGWNGTDDDPRVDVAMTQSVLGTPGVPDGGVPEVIDGGVPQYLDGGVAAPARMGDDYFWGRDDTFLEGDLERPRVRDDVAYVAGRVLVFRLPDRTEILFTARTQGVLVRLTGAVVTARISADARGLERVTVAGRWAVVDLLETAERVEICAGTPQYMIVSNLLDTAADVRRTPGTGGPTAFCDALSVGVEFTGYRAHLAGLLHAEAPPNPCRLDGGVGGIDGG